MTQCANARSRLDNGHGKGHMGDCGDCERCHRKNAQWCLECHHLVTTSIINKRRQKVAAARKSKKLEKRGRQDAHYHEDRVEIRAMMLAALPHMSQSKAESVLALYPTFSELCSASVKEISEIVISDSGKKVGSLLAKVIKRVCQ